MNKINFTLILIYALILLQGCKSRDVDESSDANDESIIVLTTEQFKASGMELGNPIPQTFEDEVLCNGYITAPSNYIATVSSPIPGIVESIHCKIGDYTTKRQIIYHISGNEFLSLQQEFAEAAAIYYRTKLDLNRAEALRAEKIGSEKSYIATETENRAAFANYNALKARIKALNIDPNQIENGQMYSSFPVISPIIGYVTKTDAVIGQYVDYKDQLVEIVNTNELQLQLSVYDRDIYKLKSGQTVNFSIGDNTEQNLTAELINIGQTIDQDKKTILCLARINKKNDLKLMNREFVNASIIIAEKQGFALPLSAIQKTGTDYFVFVLVNHENDKYHLRKQKITIGKINKHYIEILDNISNDGKIILKGIDTL